MKLKGTAIVVSQLWSPLGDIRLQPLLVPAEGRLIVAAPTSAFSREGDLRHVGKEKTMRAYLLDSSRELTMPLTRTVTMLALAREALERFDNNADAAQAYLSERLVNDEQLREALVKAAIEYERRDMMEALS
jgi:hypothetical protein